MTDLLHPLQFAALLVAAALLAGGCDTSVDPYAETELAYSVFGYLDVMADTQWVRVDLLQDSSLVGGPVDAQVTTENLATGETVVWRDSAFVLPTGQTLHNFWTDAEIAPTASYRFTVEGEAGASAAEVTMPERIPPLEVVGFVPGIGEEGGSNVVTAIVRNVEHLGGVSVFYHYLVDPPGPLTPPFHQRRRFYPLENAVQVDEETYRVTLPWRAYIERTLLPDDEFLGFFEFRISVASVSGDWPSYDFPPVEPGEPTPPQPPGAGLDSNIENGVGFLGGAATRTVYVPTIER